MKDSSDCLNTDLGVFKGKFNITSTDLFFILNDSSDNIKV